MVLIYGMVGFNDGKNEAKERGKRMTSARLNMRSAPTFQSTPTTTSLGILCSTFLPCGSLSS